MIQIHINIGEAKTLDCKNWEVTPDNRIQKIATVGGIVVQNFGHIKNGDEITCECRVDNSAKEIIFNYWQNQTKVNITDEAGVIYENMRVIVEKYSYVEMFEKKKYFLINFRFWRI